MTDAATAGAPAGGEGTTATAAAGNQTTGQPAGGASNGGGLDGENRNVTSVNGGSASTVQNWREGFDGELGEFASRFASVKDVTQAALDLRKANSSMIRVPSEGAKPEEIKAFHSKIGVPEKAADYKFDLGREPTDTDKVVIGKVADVFHAHGVPAAAATAVSKAVADLAAAQMAEEDRVAKANRETADAALKKDWGADTDRNIQVAKRAVEVYGGDELKTFLNNTVVNGQVLGDHPVLVKAFAKMGLRSGEAEFVGPVTAGDRANVQSRIDAIMAANPIGSDSYKSAAVQRELQELFGKLYGNAPAVGREGRTV
jgi:hypothetical protein